MSPSKNYACVVLPLFLPVDDASIRIFSPVACGVELGEGVERRELGEEEARTAGDIFVHQSRWVSSYIEIARQLCGFTGSIQRQFSYTSNGFLYLIDGQFLGIHIASDHGDICRD